MKELKCEELRRKEWKNEKMKGLICEVLRIKRFCYAKPTK